MRLLFKSAVARGEFTTPSLTEIDSYPALIELLITGAGVSMLPYSSIHVAVERGALSWAPFKPKPLRRMLVLARHVDRIETPAFRLFTDLVFRVVDARKSECGWTISAGGRGRTARRLKRVDASAASTVQRQGVDRTPRATVGVAQTKLREAGFALLPPGGMRENNRAENSHLISRPGLRTRVDETWAAATVAA
jgi:hypothetical protein